MYSNPKIQLILAQIRHMWYQLTSYLSHLVKSLLSSILRNSKKDSSLKICLKKPVDSRLIAQFHLYKQELLENTTPIEVTDFGAGSRIFKSNVRPVYQIARVAGMTHSKSKNLIRICQFFKPTKILEIGTSLGLGTYSLHLGAPKATITTLEGCQHTA